VWVMPNNYSTKPSAEKKITGKLALKSTENKSLKRESLEKSPGKKCTTFSDQ